MCVCVLGGALEIQTDSMIKVCSISLSCSKGLVENKCDVTK